MHILAMIRNKRDLLLMIQVKPTISREVIEKLCLVKLGL